MPKLKGKYKGKTGKVDLIEDHLSTEELAGTYEVREKTAKILRNDRMLQAEQDRLIMKGFRDREMARINEALTDINMVKMINQQVEFLLLHTMEEDAFLYLNEIRNKDTELCYKITYALVPPADMRRLGDLCARLISHGPPKNKIKKDYVIRLERAFKGIKPTVEIERDGVRETIGERFQGRKIA